MASRAAANPPTEEPSTLVGPRPSPSTTSSTRSATPAALGCQSDRGAGLYAVRGLVHRDGAVLAGQLGPDRVPVAAVVRGAVHQQQRGAGTQLVVRELTGPGAHRRHVGLLNCVNVT